jgi:nucleoid DNA-binding protein
MSNFTRKDLAVELSLKLDIPVDRAKCIVDETLDALMSALSEGRRAEFRGFGLFEAVDRKSKIGRNPKRPSAGQYLIPARKMVRFRIGKEFFDKLNPEQT